MPRAPRVSIHAIDRSITQIRAVQLVLGTVRDLFPNDGNLAGGIALLGAFVDDLGRDYIQRLSAKVNAAPEIVKDDTSQLIDAEVE